jgi:hypothetical protein
MEKLYSLKGPRTDELLFPADDRYKKIKDNRFLNSC